MDQDRLVALLKSFKERCEKEGDDEVKSAEECKRDGYYAKVTAKHIRQIDVEAWLRQMEAQ